MVGLLIYVCSFDNNECNKWMMIFQWSDTRTQLSSCYRVSHTWRRWIQSSAAWQQSLLTIPLFMLPWAISLLPFLQTPPLLLSSSSSLLNGYRHSGRIGLHLLTDAEYVAPALLADFRGGVAAMWQTNPDECMKQLEKESKTAIPSLAMIAPLIHTLKAPLSTSIPSHRWSSVRLLKLWGEPISGKVEWPSRLQHLDIIKAFDALILPPGLVSLKTRSHGSIDFSACASSLTSLIIDAYCGKATSYTCNSITSSSTSNTSTLIDNHSKSSKVGEQQINSMRNFQHMLDGFTIDHQSLFSLIGTKLQSLQLPIYPGQHGSSIGLSNTSMEGVKWPLLTTLTLNILESFHPYRDKSKPSLRTHDFDITLTCIPMIMKASLSSSLRHIHMTLATINIIESLSSYLLSESCRTHMMHLCSLTFLMYPMQAENTDWVGGAGPWFDAPPPVPSSILTSTLPCLPPSFVDKQEQRRAFADIGYDVLKSLSVTDEQLSLCGSTEVLATLVAPAYIYSYDRRIGRRSDGRLQHVTRDDPIQEKNGKGGMDPIERHLGYLLIQPIAEARSTSLSSSLHFLPPQQGKRGDWGRDEVVRVVATLSSVPSLAKLSYPYL
jgi:hypothetical protein